MYYNDRNGKTVIQKEQEELIEKYVKANVNYKGNEDLLEEFCTEALKKAYLILNTSNNEKTEIYVSKIVNATITTILKQKQRDLKPTFQEPKVQDNKDEEIILADEFETKPKETIIYDFPDPLNSIEDIVIKRELLQKIVDIVCIIHKEIPQKLYYDIFYQRYLKKKTQSEISQELNISESEVSKRLLNLSKLVSTYLYQK